MAFGSKDKKGGKSGLERIAAMFNPESKGTPSGDPDLTEMIEKALAASVGAVMFGKKNGVENYNALKGQLSKKSFIEQINDGMKGITSNTQSIRDVTKNVASLIGEMTEPIKSIDAQLLEMSNVLHAESIDAIYDASNEIAGHINMVSTQIEDLKRYAEALLWNSDTQIVETLSDIRGDLSVLFDAILESGK